MSDFPFRQVIGAALLDLPRIVPRLLNRNGWVRVCNRNDRFTGIDCRRGVRVDDRWGSNLHACLVFPWLGRLLAAKALADWPVLFHPGSDTVAEPDVTFVIPFRGMERLPQLLSVIDSITAQQEARVECLVVEQSKVTVLGGFLPRGVRHLHLPSPADDGRWHKSLAFNVGVSAAAAPVVICHDADILVPAAYSREILGYIAAGWEAVHIQRFLFKLGPEESDAVCKGRRLREISPLEVLQNWQGGTLAIRRDAFARTGGYDERFIDWGGEDNEFFDRCALLRQLVCGYVPFVHLWHPPQETKSGSARDRNVELMLQRLAIPAEQRAAELRAKQRASLQRLNELQG